MCIVPTQLHEKGSFILVASVPCLARGVVVTTEMRIPSIFVDTGDFVAA